MKAISIRQPWAELIMRGVKTIEIRTWKTNYRGKLLIHASKTVEKEACVALGLDPKELVRGAIIGFVELVGIKEYKTREDFLKDYSKHKSLKFPGKCYGWVLRNPVRLKEPIYMNGRLGLFEVNL